MRKWVSISSIAFSSCAIFLQLAMLFYAGESSANVDVIMPSMSGATWQLESGTNLVASFGGGVTPISGLVGWWKLDGDATDSSGYGNTGVLINSPTWTNGNFGQAVYFNGINQTITNAVASSNGNYTCSAWMKYTGTLPANQFYIGFSYGEAASASVWMGLFNDGKFTVSNDGPGNDLKGSILADNNWHLYTAVVTNSNRITGYIDADQIGTTTVNVNSRTGNKLIFGNLWNGSYYWLGMMDDVRIYQRALSSNEVVQIYGGAL